MVGQLWGLDNARNVDIDAPEAWSVTTGSPATIVAVLDTGIDLDHPDLAGRVWTNPGEVAANGVDDDGNGYVDDIHGWNFASNTNDVQDDNGHGSHVSGTIAASGNNGIGVVGVAWNATILPLKILAADGGGEVDAAIAAIEYAVEARGQGHQRQLDRWTRTRRPWSTPSATPGPAAWSSSTRRATRGRTTTGHPTNRARPSNQITVAAIDPAGRLAGFSNYGRRTVDLAAPGWGSGARCPADTTPTSGTSMATPHVSGVVALLAGLHPEYTAEQLVARVLATTKPLGSLTKKTKTGGMVDAAFALGVAGSSGAQSTRLHGRIAAGDRRRRPGGGVGKDCPRGPRRQAIAWAIPAPTPDPSRDRSSAASDLPRQAFA